MTAEVIHGDCLTVMREMPANGIDAIVTDPPYGLKFMGVGWDSFATPKGSTGHDRAVTFDRIGGNHNPVDGFDKARTRLVEGRKFQGWSEVWAVEALRVLKPGAYMVAFGGTRTYHRLTCAIEEAGFEVQDSLCWLFGSGFPKHKSKLKPAHEPICLARKPAARATLLNVDACRIGDADTRQQKRGGRNDFPHEDDAWTPRAVICGSAAGRWPANVVLDEVAAGALDEQSGERPSGARRPNVRANRQHVNVYDGGPRPAVSTYESVADTGGASRFFYCAKASRAEREAGLTGFEKRATLIGAAGHKINPMTGREVVDPPRANAHPTVKPVALMRWLVRLITPPNGIVLDPFCGSGTTGIAATLESRPFIGIERESDYVEIARARIAHHTPSQTALEIPA